MKNEIYFKGFNRDMTCRGFQYVQGETYEEKDAIPCEIGFHACSNPLSVLQYYKPSESVYHEVQLGGKVLTSGDKTVATLLTVGRELTLSDLVDFAVKKSTAATSGDGSTAATSGDRSTAATSGDGSTAATSGDGSTAAATGYGVRAKAKAVNSIAVANGLESKAKGVIGAYIVLVEWTADYKNIVTVKAEKVDGKKIKPDTWYIIKSGKFVEVKNEQDFSCR